MFGDIRLFIGAVLISLLGGIYLGYDYEKTSSEAKLAKSEKEHIAKLEQTQKTYDSIVASYISSLGQERATTEGLRRQILYLTKTGSSNGSSNTCYVSYGFIRLFNSSATGDDMGPQGTDNLTSEIDLTTVLSAIIENHGKYREVVKQIESMQKLDN